MTRFVPHPLSATFIFATWLVLAERITPGQILLAAIFAVAGAWAMAALGIGRPTVRQRRAALRLLRDVLLDITRSNSAVFRIILGRPHTVHSGFLIVPLDLRDRAGLVVLACIITATPGTIWVSHDRRSGRLLLHILDLVDEEAWIRQIKHRYERKLMEIFE